MDDLDFALSFENDSSHTMSVAKALMESSSVPDINTAVDVDSSTAGSIFNLNAVVNANIMEAMEEYGQAKGIQSFYKHSNIPTTVQGHAQYLRRVIYHVVSNACKVNFYICTCDNKRYRLCSLSFPFHH